MKVSLLIPSTTKRRNWKNIKETYLYTITLKSFLTTYDLTINDEEIHYKIFIGYDHDDIIYCKEEERNVIRQFMKIMKQVEIEFIPMNVEKGHVTEIWNQLYKKAYSEGYQYFYQAGDDIEYKTKGWICECIQSLQQNNDIGISGPFNGHPYLLTQAMISRKHYDIFGFLFPPEIKNWYCDDWINQIYAPNYRVPLLQYKCLNIGGEPRYDIVHANHMCKLLVTRDKQRLIKFLHSMKT
jgi:hypothetical protein